MSHITYKHRCKRCGEQVVSATVAGKQRWANLDGDKWDYVCYKGSPYGRAPTIMDRASGQAFDKPILWHEGVEMDAQEVIDLDLLNGVLNW